MTTQFVFDKTHTTCLDNTHRIRVTPMDDKLLHDLRVQVAQHDLRLGTLEQLIKAQTVSLDKLQTRLTVIGSALIGVIGVSSEQGGALLRALLG